MNGIMDPQALCWIINMGLLCSTTLSLIIDSRLWIVSPGIDCIGESQVAILQHVVDPTIVASEEDEAGSGHSWVTNTLTIRSSFESFDWDCSLHLPWVSISAIQEDSHPLIPPHRLEQQSLE